METTPTRRSLLREPFVHFVVLGAAIFGLWYLSGRSEDDVVVPLKVVVSQERRADLEAGFASTHGREPDAAERDELLREAIADEVLYREGVAAGLTEGDPIVRRRIVQKMRYLLEETRPVPEPTEAELDAWIVTHRSARRRVPAVAVKQVFFDGQRREDARRDAALALAGVQQGGDMPDGDPFLFGHEQGLRSLDRYRADFGPAFAQATGELAVGSWGLAESPWGWHLVLVEQRLEPGEQTSAFAREQAREDLLRQRRREATDVGIDELLTRYEVVVEDE